jgi:hypothetical protein
MQLASRESSFDLAIGFRAVRSLDIRRIYAREAKAKASALRGGALPRLNLLSSATGAIAHAPFAGFSRRRSPSICPLFGGARRPGKGRYFFAFFAVPFLASARRSVFLRREARFLTLSLPWLFPIRPSPSPLSGRFQVISLKQDDRAS